MLAVPEGRRQIPLKELNGSRRRNQASRARSQRMSFAEGAPPDRAGDRLAIVVDGNDLVVVPGAPDAAATVAGGQIGRAPFAVTEEARRRGSAVEAATVTAATVAGRRIGCAPLAGTEEARCRGNAGRGSRGPCTLR